MLSSLQVLANTKRQKDVMGQSRPIAGVSPGRSGAIALIQPLMAFSKDNTALSRTKQLISIERKSRLGTIDSSKNSRNVSDRNISKN